MQRRHLLCFQHDRFTRFAAGNITSDGQDTYTYYNSGRLKQVTRGTTNIYALKYNGLGQFVQRTNGNLYYLYDEAGHLLGEYASTGNADQETVYLGDTPVLTFRASSQERIADNTSTASTNKAVFTGTWATATTLKGYYGTNYRSHTSTANASTTDKVTYTITPTATQSFQVYARWVAQATNASNATYTIAPNTAGSTPTVISVNQQANGGTWNYLGTVNLNTANQMTVTLSAQGNGIVIADAIRIVPATASATQTSAFNIYTDQLNTPREIRNHANQTRWTWYPEQSGAFGAGAPDDNPNNALGGQLGTFTYNLRFPGQLYDAASGLSYNYYRDYNSRTGRYIESDPIGLEGGINTYGYVEANPLSYVDPEGLAKLPDNPGGLGDGWNRDDRHRNPNGEKWDHPDSGTSVEWHPGQPGKPGWGGKDHWHVNGGDKHLPPGTDVPDFPEPKTCSDCQKTAQYVMVGGIGYIVYRCIRMIPSLAPPLWWSIPGNVAVP